MANHQTNPIAPNGSQVARGDRRGSVVDRLVESLRQDLVDGLIRVGERLPPSRVLAEERGCSRWAVVRAYEFLAAQGLVEARVGSGTEVVRVPLPDARPAPQAPRNRAEVAIDLYPGLPDLRSFPLSGWRRAVLESTGRLTTAQLGHGDWRGLLALRQALGSYVRRARGAVTDERVELLVTCGVRDGFARVLGAFREAGHTSIAVENPGWLRLHDVAVRAGMRLVPIPVDEQGAQIDALNAHPETRLVLVTPAHHFPDGVALSESRRRQLLHWTHAYDGYVIEDDYDSEFRFGRRPTPCLQRLSPERVVMLGTFNKTIAPALGVGLMLVPRHLVDERWSAYGQPPSTLVQAPMQSFVAAGGLDRYLHRRRAVHRRARSVFVSALGPLESRGVHVGGIDAGLHLLLRVPSLPPAAILDGLAVARLRAPLRSYYTYAPDNEDAAVVIGYGHLNEWESKEAAQRLAYALGRALSSYLGLGLGITSC